MHSCQVNEGPPLGHIRHHLQGLADGPRQIPALNCISYAGFPSKATGGCRSTACINHTLCFAQVHYGEHVQFFSCGSYGHYAVACRNPSGLQFGVGVCQGRASVVVPFEAMFGSEHSGCLVVNLAGMMLRHMIMLSMMSMTQALPRLSLSTLAKRKRR